MKTENQEYIIGVDGGGTDTIAVLADLDGKILKRAKTGSSNLRNVGFQAAVSNILEAILGTVSRIKEKRVVSILIGLPAVEEEFKVEKEKIKKEILKNSRITKILKGKIEIVSDQITAFRSGTDKQDGIVLIAGTGSVAHGWKRGKEAKASGWGWLADEGSGFWIGKKGYQAIFKDLDGRGPKTKITKLIFQDWKLKNKETLMKKVYSKDWVRDISAISKIVEKAARQGDKVALEILKDAGRELVQSSISVIKKLNFQNQKFPMVFVGSVFKSKIILNILKTEVSKVAPKTQFIHPKQEPVLGAVKIAIEQIK